MTRTIHIISLTMLMLIGLCACSTSKSKSDKLIVSIPPQKYLLERLVGERMEVVCMVEQSANPETFEPTMSQLAAVENSLAYFKIGNMGFEDALSERLSKNGKIRLFDTAKGIDFIRGTHEQHDDNERIGEHTSGEHHHEIDPHVWSSVGNCIIIARNMLSALTEIDPKNTTFYQKNFEQLHTDLKQLDDSIRTMLAPYKGTTFIVWHPSLSYFARDYSLKQISIEHEGKESSIKGFRAKLDKTESSGAHVFFYQQEYDSRQMSDIASELHLRLVQINPMNADVHKELLSTAKALTVHE